MSWMCQHDGQGVWWWLIHVEVEVVVVILPVCILIVNSNSKVPKKTKKTYLSVLLCGVVVVVGDCHVLHVLMWWLICVVMYH